MKKKTKLLVTILSLCLTISLFTFSVYAATQVNYQVQGNVTYRIRDVLATITTNIAKSNTHQGFTNITATMPNNDFGEDELFDEYCTYSNNQIDQDEEYSPDKSIIVDFNESSLWRVTITIETINEDFITIETSNNYGISASANYGIEKVGDAEEIYEGISATFFYYIYLKDPTKKISTSNFNISLTLSLGV